MPRFTEEQFTLLLKGGFAPPSPKRKKSKPESGVVSACLKWLWYRGCYVWRNNTGALKTNEGQWVRFGLKGSADIIGVSPAGRFLAIECKAPGQYLKPEQKAFRDTIEAHKGIYVMARSTDDLEKMQGIILGQMGMPG